MKNQLNEYNLKNCNIFKDLDDKEIILLFKDLHYQIKNIEKEQYIAFQGTRCDNLIILLQGKVSAEIRDLKEGKIHVSEISAISNLAPAFLFGENNFFPLDIIAKEKVIILKIPKDTVVKMLVRNFKFSLNLLNAVSDRTQYVMSKMKYLSFQSLKEKLALYLLKISEEKKTDIIQIEISQQKLSELFGVARQSLARTTKQMCNENIIKKNKRKITILDKKALCQIINK